LYPQKLEKQNIKDFGDVVVFVILIAGYFLHDEKYILYALIALLFNLTFYQIYKPFAKLWFKLSVVLGGVSNKIILGAVFLLLVVPIGFFVRLMSKDRLRINLWKNGDSSVFINIDNNYKPEDMENPY
jgi:hypothetical protein